MNGEYYDSAFEDPANAKALINAAKSDLLSDLEIMLKHYDVLLENQTEDYKTKPHKDPSRRLAFATFNVEYNDEILKSTAREDAEARSQEQRKHTTLCLLEAYHAVQEWNVETTAAEVLHYQQLSNHFAETIASERRRGKPTGNKYRLALAIHNVWAKAPTWEFFTAQFNLAPISPSTREQAQLDWDNGKDLRPQTACDLVDELFQTDETNEGDAATKTKTDAKTMRKYRERMIREGLWAKHSPAP